MIRKSGLSQKFFLVGLGAITIVFLSEKKAFAYAGGGEGILYHIIIMAFAAATMYVTFLSSWIKKKLKKKSKEGSKKTTDVEQ